MRFDRVTLALLTVQLLFAIHYVAAKHLLEHIPPPAWAALRVTGAAAIMLAFTRHDWPRWPRSRRMWARLALLSVFGVIVNQILFVEGLSRTVPSHSALINTSIPVVTLLAAVLLRQEHFDRRKIAAVAVALTGVLILLRVEDFDPSAGTVQGDLLTLANASSFSVFLVLSRPVARELGARIVTPIVFGIGAIAITLFGLPSLVSTDWSAVPPLVWLLAMVIVLGPTVGTYALNVWALRRVESSRVALFVYLQFVLAAPLSAWLLDEPLSLRLIPAAALVFLGVALTRRRPTRPTPAT